MKKKIKVEKKSKKKIESVEELEKKVQENLEGWQRAKADYENLKKRTMEEKKKILDYANEDLILNLLPIIDNFNSAYKNIPNEIENNSWVQGIGFIKDQMEKFLVDNNITEIKSEGRDFDPSLHEAVESVKSKEPSGKILTVVLKGYKYKDKIIRPAKVKVAIADSANETADSAENIADSANETADSADTTKNDEDKDVNK